MQATRASRRSAKRAHSVVHNAGTPLEAGFAASRPSANDPQIAPAATAKRSLIAAAIGFWKVRAATFRPIARDVGSWLPSVAARHAAPRNRVAALSGVLRAVGARIGTAWKARQHHRAAMRDIEILRQLDDATLRDIGVLRDEIPAAAYERARNFRG